MANGDTTEIDLFITLTEDEAYAELHRELVKKCLTFANDLVTDIDLVVNRMERIDEREEIHSDEMMEAIYETHRKEHISRIATLLVEEALQRAVLAAKL